MLWSGIDPVTVQSIQGVIRDLSRQGISILITDHAAREILQLVDHCYVISDGHVLFHGTPEDVRAHPEVRRKYLGDDPDEDPSESTPRPKPNPNLKPPTPPRDPRSDQDAA